VCWRLEAGGWRLDVGRGWAEGRPPAAALTPAFGHPSPTRGEGIHSWCRFAVGARGVASRWELCPPAAALTPPVRAPLSQPWRGELDGRMCSSLKHGAGRGTSPLATASLRRPLATPLHGVERGSRMVSVRGRGRRCGVAMGIMSACGRPSPRPSATPLPRGERGSTGVSVRGRGAWRGGDRQRRMRHLTPAFGHRSRLEVGSWRLEAGGAQREARRSSYERRSGCRTSPRPSATPLHDVERGSSLAPARGRCG
jgi:hypothetical protein